MYECKMEYKIMRKIGPMQMHTCIDHRNPTCSQFYDHEWLKADYKPDPPQCKCYTNGLDEHCDIKVHYTL